MEDSVFRASQMSLSSTTSLLETVKIELPPLGSEFRGREDFLDSMITTLNELQKVNVCVCLSSMSVHVCAHLLVCVCILWGV